MARRPASVAASRIRIEDEVWEEAFASRVPSRNRRPAASVRPARPITGRHEPDAPALRIAEPPVITAVSQAPAAPATPAVPAGTRRTVRIQGRGADPYRSHTAGEKWTPYQALPVVRTVGSSPDRLAMWAALLGFVLVVVALLSSHF